MTNDDLVKMVDRMRRSPVAGAGRLDAEKGSFMDKLTAERLGKILETIFREILLEYGYTVREDQIALAHEMLGTIGNRAVSLNEAEVGIGKTIAYLLAAILTKRGRLNDFWNMGLYPDMQYADMAHMPIVISTSSIALQKAIVRDYIPALSQILTEQGILRTPITAVIRKGKEHFVCDRNLIAHIPFEFDPVMKHQLEKMLWLTSPIDLTEVENLTAHVKRKICVPRRCPKTCPQYRDCRYIRFLNLSQSLKIDFQVCNHNYLLADTLRRANGLKQLIPNYQALVIDETHKFLNAARSMYGAELSSVTLPGILQDVDRLKYATEDYRRSLHQTAKKLCDQSRRLFRRLIGNAPRDLEDDVERYTAVMDKETARHLHNISAIAEELRDMLTAPVAASSEGLRSKLRWELASIGDQTDALAHHSGHICWLESVNAGGQAEHLLCSIPKNLGSLLHRDLWNRSIPTILTSGTLSANGDFSRIKQTLGLDRLSRLHESCKPSPFNHRENALLYISEAVPFPDGKDQQYIKELTDEIERLIYAAHGHTAVLFTSYRVLGLVHAELQQRKLAFPLFRLERGGTSAIERFKQRNGGVLLASGSLWEGIDIPGDALSLLIIVKLPFAVPDPISVYEQTHYSDFTAYKDCVIVPDMLLKLKQGFGRLIRTETDTGVVALLDSRVGEGGAYKEKVLAALPAVNITSDLNEVATFIRKHKSPDYFV